ncbi:MAG TPA: alpha/beta hydrolase [Mucilaginibacter sp.]
MKNDDPIQPYTTGSVVSKDGTTISYRQLGQGPGLIIVHGGMQAAQNFMKLANALASQYTLYMPDRRGRGASGVPGVDYGIEKECEDIEALLVKTGARFIFGLSSGAIISLNATLKYPAIRKAAIYEPPFPIDPTTPDYRFIKRYNKEIAQNKPGAAFISVITGLKMSFLLGLVPRFIMEPLANMLMKRNEEQLQPGEIPLNALVPCFKYDHILVDETKGELDKFRQVKADILLLSGSRSPHFLKQVINRLKAMVPHSRHVEFKGLDHMGSDNSGKPKVVAEELHQFFGNG